MKLTVYMLSHEDMQMLDSLRHWLGTVIYQNQLAKDQQSTAADFAIDISEVLSSSPCATIEPCDP